MGDTLYLNNHTFIFHSVKQIEGENYNSIQALFHLTDEGEVIEEFHPEIRFYNDPPTITSETSIAHRLFKDIYIVMNVPQEQDSISVRVHIKPFMNFIWLSVFMMVIGGMFSIFFRVKS